MNLDINLIGICKSKKIEVIDDSTFVLNKRGLILDYHFLTGDYQNLIQNLRKGKATLNEKQLEEYQRKDLVRNYRGKIFLSWDGLLHKKLDGV